MHAETRKKARHVPGTVVIGPHGPAVTRGYTEIAGVRFYQDQVVVDQYGQHVISPGYVEPAGRRALKEQAR